MKAIVVHAFGDPDVMRLEEVADPQPGPGQVAVRLHAAGVNPVETYIRAGAYGRLPALPYTPGSDGAGVVTAVGAGVEGRAPGDRVYVAGAPTYAEGCLAPAASVWPLPANLDFAQGAAIGVPYLTAYRGLHHVGRVRAGDWVLVHGASGAVGTAAVQIAAAAGASVAGTAGSEPGRAHVLQQGAAAALDHGDRAGAMALTGGRGFDVIVEMLANVNLGTDLGMLAPGGRVVVIGSRGRVEVDARDLMSRDGSVHGFTGFTLTDDERRRIHLALGAGFRQGTLRPVVGRSLALADAPAAHDAVMAPGALGKVVLTAG